MASQEHHWIFFFIFYDHCYCFLTFRNNTGVFTRARLVFNASEKLSQTASRIAAAQSPPPPRPPTLG